VGDTVVKICAAVAKILGDEAADRTVTRGFTDERADIPQQMKSVFANRTLSLTSEQPEHTGEFALVYSGVLDEERVAVKVVPTTALRKLVQRTLKIAEDAREKLRDTLLWAGQHGFSEVARGRRFHGPGEYFNGDEDGPPRHSPGMP
jgi:hypothetical protein